MRAYSPFPAIAQRHVTSCSLPSPSVRAPSSHPREFARAARERPLTIERGLRIQSPRLAAVAEQVPRPFGFWDALLPPGPSRRTGGGSVAIKRDQLARVRRDRKAPFGPRRPRRRHHRACADLVQGGRDSGRAWSLAAVGTRTDLSRPASRRAHAWERVWHTPRLDGVVPCGTRGRASGASGGRAGRGGCSNASRWSARAGVP